MTTKLTTIAHDQLATICGGAAATNPWATFGTDLKTRIDGELASARTRFDNYKPTTPTMPTTPTIPSVPSRPSTRYPHCLPTRHEMY